MGNVTKTFKVWCVDDAKVGDEDGFHTLVEADTHETAAKKWCDDTLYDSDYAEIYVREGDQPAQMFACQSRRNCEVEIIRVPLEDVVTPKLPGYCYYRGQGFQMAALVLAGKEGTYAVLDTVGLDEWLKNDCMTRILPDGTYDGEITHPAAIVTFKLEVLHFWKHPEESEPEEYGLTPDQFIPVLVDEAWRTLTENEPIWDKVANENES